MNIMSLMMYGVGGLWRFRCFRTRHTASKNHQYEGMATSKTSSSRHIVKKCTTIILDDVHPNKNFSVCYIEIKSVSCLARVYFCKNAHYLNLNIPYLFPLYRGGEKL